MNALATSRLGRAIRHPLGVSTLGRTLLGGMLLNKGPPLALLGILGRIVAQDRQVPLTLLNNS